MKPSVKDYALCWALGHCMVAFLAGLIALLIYTGPKPDYMAGAVFITIAVCNLISMILHLFFAAIDNL